MIERRALARPVPPDVRIAEEFRCGCGAVVRFHREDWDGPLRRISHSGSPDVAELAGQDIWRLFGDDHIITLGREPTYLHPALVDWLRRIHGD